MVQEFALGFPTQGNVRPPAPAPRDRHQQEEIRRRQVGIQLPCVQVHQEDRQVFDLQGQPQHRKRTSIQVETQRCGPPLRQGMINSNIYIYHYPSKQLIIIEFS